MMTELVKRCRSLEKADPGTDLPPVVIIEARSLFRECLALSLQQRLSYPVITYPNLESWKGDQAESSAGVIIVGALDIQDDSKLPRVLQEVSGNAEATPVIVFSDVQDSAQVIHALGCGAKGYILSTTSLEMAAEAIRLVMAGGSFIPADIVIGEARCDADPEIDCSHPATRFTGREDEVVRALLKGKPNKLIAHDLNISESCVKVHIRGVMRKLGVRTRTEAVTKISEIIRRFSHDPTVSLLRHGKKADGKTSS